MEPKVDSKEIGKKTYLLSEEVAEVARKVLEEEKLNLEPARIGYLEVYPNISNTRAGKCIKSGAELKYFSGHDYIVEVSGELWDKLSDQLRYILVFHELLHVLPVMNEKTGEVSFHIQDHDIKDFYRIVSKYGVNWINELKTLNTAVYKLDGDEAGVIKI